MTDLQLKKAVAKCAGWEWTGRFAIDRTTGPTAQTRLAETWPLFLDHVVAACEAAGVESELHSNHNAQHDERWTGLVWEHDGFAHRKNNTDPSKALALALIEACGVEVEDE